jgi:hypothetical protein
MDSKMVSDAKMGNEVRTRIDHYRDVDNWAYAKIPKGLPNTVRSGVDYFMNHHFLICTLDHAAAEPLTHYSLKSFRDLIGRVRLVENDANNKNRLGIKTEGLHLTAIPVLGREGIIENEPNIIDALRRLAS